MAIAFGLIDPVEVHLPRLPHALDGLRIAHVSDLHVRRPRRVHERLAAQLTSQRIDLIVLTGDYMNRAGRDEEPHAHAVLQTLLERARPRIGTFGVFGNHDTHELRERCADLPVRWLANERVIFDDRPIELLGLQMLKSTPTDAVALALDGKPHHPHPAHATASLEENERPLRLMLAHKPDTLGVAADLGADLLVCGHTHGGQCRLPTGHPLFNASALPLKLTSGLLRHRDTLIGVSRGVGIVGYIPRIWCRPHVPIYTLRRGTMPGTYTDAAENLRPW